MDIIYLNHSAFYVKLENKNILIDYGSMPKRPLNGRLNKGIFDFSIYKSKTNLIGYSSHRHADHFDENLIKQFLQNKIPYILSDETAFSIETYMQDSNFYRILPNSLWEIEGLKIANTGSTDQGGSILFQEQSANYSIYYGADLAVWDDFPEFYEGFSKEFNWLSEVKDQFSPVKVAFLPSGTGDGYQEDPLLDGAMQMINLLKPDLVIPMHGANYPEYYPGFVTAMQKRFGKTKIDTGTFNKYDENMIIDKKFQLYYPEKPGDMIQINMK